VDDMGGLRERHAPTLRAAQIPQQRHAGCLERRERLVQGRSDDV
jgi:hypothetical protein